MLFKLAFFPYQTQREPPPVPIIVKYFSIVDIQKELETIPAPWFVVASGEESIHIGRLDDHNNLKYRLFISSDLTAELFIYGLKATKINMEQKTLQHCLDEVDRHSTCLGIQEPHFQDYASLPNGNESFYRHVMNHTTDHGLTYVSTVRAADCQIMLPSNGQISCLSCQRIQKMLEAKISHQRETEVKPLHPNAPLRTIARKKLENALKTERSKQKMLLVKLEKMKEELEHRPLDLPKDLHGDLKKAVEEGVIEDPLAKLFWEEQIKAFQKPNKGMRWHPTMVRLAILLRCQSKAAYTTLRNTGILKLPGESTLKDYTNAVLPQAGFNTNTLQELTKTTKDWPDSKRFIVLMHDEMSIKEDLVFDRRSGEVVGFINPANWRPDGQTLATHVLVFMAVGVNTSLKTTIGYMATRTCTADVLYPLLWKAIGHLEICGLRVMASISDKATPNQRLYRLHRQDDGVCYKALNLFCPDRYVYFISDAPHLIKTVRNNLASSGAGRNTKLLWVRTIDYQALRLVLYLLYPYIVF